MKIRHIGIVVENLEESLDFYQGIFGGTIFKQMEESGDFISNISALDNVTVTTVKLLLIDGSMIELLKYHSHPNTKIPRGINEIGISHIAFTVDDVNKIYEKLKNKIYFTTPPRVSPDGLAKVTFCSAPEGTYIELVEEL